MTNETETIDDFITIYKQNITHLFYLEYKDLGFVLSKMIGNLTEKLIIFGSVPSDHPNLYQNYAISGILKFFMTRAITKNIELVKKIKNKTFLIEFFVLSQIGCTYSKFKITIPQPYFLFSTSNKYCIIEPI